MYAHIFHTNDKHIRLRYGLSILLSLLLTFPLNIKAEKWSVETLEMPYLKDAHRYVCNPDGVLSAEIVAKSDSLLHQLEKDKGVQTIVVTVKQLKGDDPYQFGMDLGRKYGIGSKKQRTGLIVILATEDRSYQILTGNGLEGTLPDAICRRIQNRVMVPELKKSNWDAAIYKTLQTIDGYVRNDSTISADIDEDDKDEMILGALFAAMFIGGFIVITIVAANQNRCPHCKKAQLRPTKRQRLRIAHTNSWCIKTTYRCPRCGYEKVGIEEDHHSNLGGGIMPPIILGGGGGLGNGSFGGTFGGGSFGGGGSGGRF